MLLLFAVAIVGGVLLDLLKVTPIGAARIDSPFALSVLVVLLFAANTLIVYLAQRVDVSLPAAAIGNSMGSLDAWTDTDIGRGPILAISAVLLVLNTLQIWGPTFFLWPYPFLLSVANPLLTWLTWMINYSVLAVLYQRTAEDFQHEQALTSRGL